MIASVDPQSLSDVLGSYPTGVSVITALSDDGRALAMVVGSFAAVSKEPPLISFMPAKTSRSFAQLREATRFVVNIVAHDQEGLVRRLARSDSSKMDREPWRRSSLSGAPILDGVVASIECEMRSVLDAGDHYIVLGAVQQLRAERPTIPLLYFRGGYGEFAPKSFVVTERRGLSGAVASAQALRGQIEHAALEFGGEVTVFGRIAGDSVALATAAAPGGDQITPLGTRYALTPPIGALYHAWSDEREQQTWIGRAVGATAEERARYSQQLENAREHGWSVSVLPDDDADRPEDPGSSELDDVVRHIRASARVRDVPDIVADDWYRVVGLMAPIFTADSAAPELMIRVLLYPSRRMPGDEVLALGELLQAFSADASARIRAELTTPV